jgi:DNA-binding XRE family transcriptional regulator
MEINFEPEFASADDIIAALESIPGINDNLNERIAAREQMERSYRTSLAAIREVAALTQNEVAQKMGVAQSAVSRLERRDDWLLSTMKSYFDALGAEASLNIRIAGTNHTIRFDELVAS